MWEHRWTRGEYSSAAFSSSRSAAPAHVLGSRSGSVGRRSDGPGDGRDLGRPADPDHREAPPVDVTTLEWTITFAVTVGVLLFDVVVIARDPREPSMKECAVALCFYVGGAVVFGLWILAHHGHDYGVQFYAGWLTEYSLSIDNLFVFLILMAALKVPRKYQQEALLVGIILALVFRGVFIALGYTLIENFSWVFYLFGAFLVYTAAKLVGSYTHDEEEHPEDNTIVKFAQRHLNVGTAYHGLRLWYVENGTRVVSPILIVI